MTVNFRSLIFFIFLPIILFHAGPVPAVSILDEQAKHPPKASRKFNRNKSSSPGKYLVLGRRNDISAVKYRYRPTSRQTTYSSKYRATGIRKKITSKSAIVIDAESGETLFALRPDSPRQPASTIKVLTAMIALKSLQQQEKVPVSSHASRMPRSKIYLDTGRHYLANDLINAVLLASANDASVALAEKIAGSESDFARMMTLRARLWGAKRTVCRTATGLTAKGQQSTARDLAMIFRHAMQDENFARRMRQIKARTSYGTTLHNHNKALWRIKGAVGGKTGYTAAARQTYVGQFCRGNDSIIVAIMGSETMWSDIRRLVEYGFQRKRQIRLARAESGKEPASRIN